MKKILYTALALFALGVLSVNAQTLFANYDASPAIRIYNGYTGSLSVVVSGSGTGFVATVDGLANTLNGDGSDDTVAEIAALFAACTNASGTAALLVDTSVSLSTDSTDAELLSGTYTASAGEWLELPWDTSAALHYDASIQKAPQFKPGTMIDVSERWHVPGVIKNVYGDIAGTGNVTVSIYVNGTAKFTQVVPSPRYELGAGGTNVANNAVYLQDLNIPQIAYGPQDAVLIRAARATTATTGSIGFSPF